ncbi:MAG: SDR family NAD(P)-dependent oxidoreductase [Bradymonadia bacterium]
MSRIIVFGATSKIATEAIERWASRGDQLYLVGRNPEKLQSLVARLPDHTVAGSQAVDLATADGAALVAEGIDALGGLDVALIAHGLLSDQISTEHDLDAARHCFEVNLLSVVALLIPLANHFETQSSGRLAVITSVAAERGRPRNYTYGAAKAALNTYLQGLRTRLYPHVHIITLKVGPTDTPMTEDHSKHPLFAEAHTVGEGIVKAVDAGAPVAWLPGYWRPLMGVIRRLPESVFSRVGFLGGR